ncbi:hypothetical protein QF117_03985 [Vibrio sp. YMD68]|uniref:hypothetical protein n=1 Tax=Vibrio sp. YMD68 TaxID=3042300 RepID=UPI00249C0433|nr:hypothetical protein [Vibrio sp. YMD68]WGV98027.1 hypothetical protein QF117_03985 [Vibrio sp. YMD68]
MFKKSITLLLTTLLVSTISYSHASDISISLVENTPYISATEDGHRIQYYNEHGDANGYVWIDVTTSEILHYGISYILDEKDKNKTIALCSKDRIYCSNEINLAEYFYYKIALKSLTSPLDFNGYWEVDNKITNQGLIYLDTNPLTSESNVNYISEEDFSTDIPNIGAALVGFYDEDDTLLYLETFSDPETVKADENGAIYEVEQDINFGDSATIKLCTVIFTDSGETAIVEPDCDLRLISDKPTPPKVAKYYFPPTVNQYSALFDGRVPLIEETTLGTTYVSSPRIVSDSNYLEYFCSTIEGSSPLTTDQLIDFSTSEYFDDFWPGKTGYWTNDEAQDPRFEINGGLGVIVTISGTGSVLDAANSYYDGFFICINNNIE